MKRFVAVFQYVCELIVEGQKLIVKSPKINLTLEFDDQFLTQSQLFTNTFTFVTCIVKNSAAVLWCCFLNEQISKT